MTVKLMTAAAAIMTHFLLLAARFRPVTLMLAKGVQEMQGLSLGQQEKNKTGPHLVGIIGRTAGSLKATRNIPSHERVRDRLGRNNPDRLSSGAQEISEGYEDGVCRPEKDTDIENVIAYLKAP